MSFVNVCNFYRFNKHLTHSNNRISNTFTTFAIVVNNILFFLILYGECENGFTRLSPSGWPTSTLVRIAVLFVVSETQKGPQLLCTHYRVPGVGPIEINSYFRFWSIKNLSQTSFQGQVYTDGESFLTPLDEYHR